MTDAESQTQPTVWLLNGPNLDRLGKREPEVYGYLSLSEIEATCEALAAELGLRLTCRQSASEAELIGWLHQAADEGALGVVMNPAAYSHSSIALRDAVSAISPVPVVEVHLSNVHAREDFRHVAMTAGACVGAIAGLGAEGYLAALRFLSRRAS